MAYRWVEAKKENKKKPNEGRKEMEKGGVKGETADGLKEKNEGMGTRKLEPEPQRAKGAP